MFKSLRSPEQWAEARRLRGEGATFAAIAKHLGLTVSTVSQRARKEGWPSPAGSLARAKRSSAASPPPASSADARRSLARRLFTVMDLNLELMELRMHKQLKQARKQKDGDIPAGDVEKDMRQLTTTMKTIEQATELDPDRAHDADGGAKSSDAATRASEAEALRREIAERIEKLIPPS